MKKIFEKLFGRKYWIVTYTRMQMDGYVSICDTVYSTREEAMEKFHELRYGTRIIRPIAIESFRSREEYGDAE